MNYAPDFVNLLCFLGIAIGSGGIMYRMVQVDLEWRECDSRKLWNVWSVVCIVVQICFRERMAVNEPFPKVCLLTLAIYFVVCTTMDSMLAKVNNVMQYLGVIGGGAWVLYCQPEKEIGISILLFAMIQYTVFRRMYGGADVMAFLICSLYLAGQNKDIEAYLFHMAACYLLVAMVQGYKRNISSKGNLKKAIPLYPYILTGFLLIFYQ